MNRLNKLTALAAVVALSVGLAACGGGGSSTATMPPEPTPYETASTAIAAATTAEAAQAAYDAVKDQVTAAQGDMLQMKVNERIAALATAARVAEQKAVLMAAAGMIDTSDLSTQELVDAARAAIVELRGALAAAADVSDADKAMYMSRLNDAVAAVDTAQGGIDTATRRTNQMDALSSASTTLQGALAALSGSTPTQAQLDAANAALAALNMAVTDGADLTDEEKAPYRREAANAAAPIQTAQTAFNNAQDADKAARDKAMAATAKKLYDGIGATPLTGHSVTFSEAGVPTVDPAGDLEAQVLTEDKKTAVADNHGWQGTRYTASGTGVVGMYEAVIYSNVGMPTQGKKFGKAGSDADYQYNLEAVSNTELGVTSVEGYAALVASSSFDQSAGKKEFTLPSNTVKVMLSGSFHGVSGTYSCTPTSAETKCSATVAAKGFTLAGGTWTFKASNNEARVMSTPDAIYARYGWWIHKAANDGDFTASAFMTDRGDVPNATGLDALEGTATYMGGAAGKYALRSSTGGTNDAGHFTARATLNADFSDDSITGTIDNFMGADGKMRNWSVELKEAALADGGGISRSAADDTVWTIDGTAGSASGEWSGSLQDNDDAGVPKVGSGTFHTTFNDDGRMVGAFGVNKQ